MKIAIPTETQVGESRVAASPDTVKAYVKKGVEVVVEAGAGKGASISDEAFAAAGARIVVLGKLRPHRTPEFAHGALDSLVRVARVVLDDNGIKAHQSCLQRAVNVAGARF